MRNQPPMPDVTTPSAARIYDYYLGGTTNFEVDRAFAQKAIATFPMVRPVAIYNRRFVRQVVRRALDQGVCQFLDLGAGIPTVGNVHTIIQQHHPAHNGRVVYVDNEPVAASHARIVLEQDGATDWAGMAQADLCDPEAVLTHPEVTRLIDLTQPICVLMAAVLHFVDDESAAGLVRRYRQQLAPGSWLAVSHISSETASPEETAMVERFRVSYEGTQNPLYVRGREEILPWLSGLEMLDPGLVALPDWPDTDGDSSEEGEVVRPFAWCGVGVVPPHPGE